MRPSPKAGCGLQPERGRGAAQENLDEIRQLLGDRTKMVFITAGMGGGTGTGAAPVIASVARELGIPHRRHRHHALPVEGCKRKQQATTGSTRCVMRWTPCRDQQRPPARPVRQPTLDNAFEHADNVLTTAARGIAEIITMTGKVNVDFEDVKTVMTGSGGHHGHGRERRRGPCPSCRIQESLASPLLNDNDIRGAKYVLLNITHGTQEVLMDDQRHHRSHPGRGRFQRRCHLGLLPRRVARRAAARHRDRDRLQREPGHGRDPGRAEARSA